MQHKKLIGLLTTLASVTLLAACSPSKENSTTASSTTESSSVDLSKVDLPQLDPKVRDNEDLVEIETTAGKVTVKLFPEYAPKAVENFMTHAKDGYYNGTGFHRVINEFMIQGGDPKGDGTGGESIWGEGFDLEISPNLYHIRGALSMANAGQPNSQGSQFFIVQNDQDMSDGLAIQFTPEKMIEAYKKGGYPSLDGQYTVFGQVTEGMDIVDKISQAKTDANDKPEKMVTIKKINIVPEAK